MRIPILSSIIRTIQTYVSSGSVAFPTETYRFTTRDAEKVQSIISRGALHESAGSEVVSLEKEFALYHNVQHSYATNSGTSALELAMRLIGLQPGDEVLLPAYTLVSTASAVLQNGGIPVFVDIDDTFTISPESLTRHITKRTKAIIAVHMFGNVADMGTIVRIAAKHKLFVIEDCCQATGAEYNKQKVGTLGDIGCFSFSAGKAIFTGEGGMIIASNKRINKRLQHIKYELEHLHSNTANIETSVSIFRMTEMQASLARSILSQLDTLNNIRRRNFQFITTLLTHALPLKLYRVVPRANPSFSRLVFMIDFHALHISRSLFIKKLKAVGIPLKTFYPYPLYSFSLFQRKYDAIIGTNYPFSYNNTVNYKKIKLPFVERFCTQQVGISFSPYISKAQLRYLCAQLNTMVHSHV